MFQHLLTPKHISLKVDNYNLPKHVDAKNNLVFETLKTLPLSRLFSLFGCYCVSNAYNTLS